MLNEKGFLNGSYDISYELQSYVNDGYAIWYDSSNSLWVIGKVENIGQSSAYLLAYDSFSGLTDTNNEWLYYFDGNWVPSSPNDINVTCKNVENLMTPSTSSITTSTDAVTPSITTSTDAVTPLMNATLGLCLINKLLTR